MKIVLPYTRVNEQVFEAVRSSGFPWMAIDVSDSDEAYWHLLDSLFRVGEDFCIHEHDILPLPNTFAEYNKCPEPWCASPFFYLDSMHFGLGSVRFRPKLIPHPETLMTYVAKHERIAHSSKHWCDLAARIGLEIDKNRNVQHHEHMPVWHLDPLPSHRCVPWAENFDPSVYA